MNLQLDTHSFLWYVWDDSRLSEKAATAIEDSRNVVYVSVVSLWEITLKNSLGKLALNLPLADFFAKNVDGNGFRVLPITRAHLLTVQRLPFHHRDPFDRLLIAQSIADDLTFVTKDRQASQYDVALLLD